jgi:hypothetical protein
VGSTLEIKVTEGTQSVSRGRGQAMCVEEPGGTQRMAGDGDKVVT